MFLALREIRRSKARFGMLVIAVAMLVFLILFQQAIGSALVRAFTGAIENQTAPVLVYSVDGQRVLQGSVITPAPRAMKPNAHRILERIVHSPWRAAARAGCPILRQRRP